MDSAEVAAAAAADLVAAVDTVVVVVAVGMVEAEAEAMVDGEVIGVEIDQAMATDQALAEAIGETAVVTD